MLWAYCRVSTTYEAQEVSLDDQEAYARGYAAERGEPVRVFRERASAKTTVGRPIFQAMMAELAALAPAQRPEQLVISRFDRLSRSMTDTLVVVRTLQDLKVALVTRDAGLVRAETFADRAALVGQSMGGEAENEARSNRMKASIARRRGEGKATSQKAPYGIQLRGGFDTPNGEGAEWVRRAFAWYAAGIGTVTIATRFRDGAPEHVFESVEVDSATGKPKMRVRPSVWDPSRVGKLLSQRRYREVVVPAALWDRVQEVRAHKPRWRTDRRFDFLLSGLVRCPSCPRALSGRATGGSRNRWTRKDGTRVYGRPRATRTRYYYCTACRRQYNAERIERAFRARCEHLLADPALLVAWIAGERTDEAPLRRELARLEAEIAPEALEGRERGVWELALAAAIGADDLAGQLRRMRAEIVTKRERIAQLRATLEEGHRATRSIAGAERLLRRFWERYPRLARDEQRFLMSELVALIGPLHPEADGLRFGSAAPST